MFDLDFWTLPATSDIGAYRLLPGVCVASSSWRFGRMCCAVQTCRIRPTCLEPQRDHPQQNEERMVQSYRIHVFFFLRFLGDFEVNISQGLQPRILWPSGNQKPCDLKNASEVFKATARDESADRRGGSICDLVNMDSIHFPPPSGKVEWSLKPVSVKSTSKLGPTLDTRIIENSIDPSDLRLHDRLGA